MHDDQWLMKERSKVDVPKKQRLEVKTAVDAR